MTDQWKTEGSWEIDGDAKDLIHVPREKEYPYRLIITEEEADKLKALGVWERTKDSFIVIKKDKR
jgi:hypothetical protein